MILALDTCQPACSVALGTADGRVLSHRWEQMGRGHAERLLPMIEEVLVEGGVEKPTLTKVLVTLGPGTFAGQRIGIAAARALALAIDIQVMGLTVTELLAAQWAAKQDDGSGLDRLLTILDARRNEAYIQTFEKQAGQIVPLDQVRMINLEELSNNLPATPFAVAGTGQSFVQGAQQTDIVLPDAKYAIGLGVAVEQSVMRLPRPLYLRAPDADLPKNRPPQRADGPNDQSV